MSLGENSLVAAYQRKGQLKSRPSGTRVVTFIGGSGGIRTRAPEETGVDTIFSESETYSETVRITRGSGRTFLCAARDLFGVVVAKKKRLWRTQRHFILRNFWSRSGFYVVKFVCRLISSGRLDEDFLRSFAVFWRRGSTKTTGNGRTTQFNAEVAKEKV